MVVLLIACAADAPPRAEVAGVTLERERDDAAAALEPETLPGGPARLGAFLGFGDDEVELGGVGPITADQGAGVVVDAIRSDDGATVSCVPRLEAAADRPLVAVGTLEVVLVLIERAGGEQRGAPEADRIDVRVEPGETGTLAATSGTEIDPGALAEVRCEGDFTPE